jgi:hypothetical protein
VKGTDGHESAAKRLAAGSKSKRSARFIECTQKCLTILR